MPKKLGKQIKDARCRARMSQAQLAERLGASIMSVNRWENDKARPRYDMQCRLIEVLGLNEDIFLEREETPALPVQGSFSDVPPSSLEDDVSERLPDVRLPPLEDDVREQKRVPVSQILDTGSVVTSVSVDQRMYRGWGLVVKGNIFVKKITGYVVVNDASLPYFDTSATGLLDVDTPPLYEWGWGYASDRLAASILADYFEFSQGDVQGKRREFLSKYTARFKWDVARHFTRNWTLSSHQIADWLVGQEEDEKMWHTMLDVFRSGWSHYAVRKKDEGEYS